jgi:hypothetical protein
MAEGGQGAVATDEDVVGASKIVTSRERSSSWSACSARKRWRRKSSGRLSTQRAQKTDLAARVVEGGCFPMSCAAKTLSVARSNLADRKKGATKPRGRFRKAADAELTPLTRAIVDERPTYGYRRICALANRRSNCRWCSDHLEIGARNGEVVCVLFVIDGCDREIIA